MLRRPEILEASLACFVEPGDSAKLQSEVPLPKQTSSLKHLLLALWVTLTVGSLPVST